MKEFETFSDLLEVLKNLTKSHELIVRNRADLPEDIQSLTVDFSSHMNVLVRHMDAFIESKNK